MFGIGIFILCIVIAIVIIVLKVHMTIAISNIPCYHLNENYLKFDIMSISNIVKVLYFNKKTFEC